MESEQDDNSDSQDEPMEDESDIEEDMGPKHQLSSEESDEEESKPGVYKAPKLNAVVYEDKNDKKARMKDTYERKKLGKSGLMQEMMKEMADEPEEVYMGANKKSKSNKYADLVEENEVENFTRYQMTNKQKKAMRYRQIEDQ